MPLVVIGERQTSAYKHEGAPMNTGLAALIQTTEAQITDLINAAGDLNEEGREIEDSARWEIEADRKVGARRLIEIGREVRAIEVRLLSLYFDLGLAKSEQAMLIRAQGQRIAFA